MNHQKKFTVIDLFAGIGGFRKALQNLGGECIHFSEINNDAIQTYCDNFSETSEKNLGDITKIKTLPPHDILTAGVPCQSWSIAGRKLGFDDDRGQLWNDTLCLLHQSQPKAFIFENVKGLMDPRNKNALLYILQRIKEAGYFAQHYLVNSYDYGVPQNRMRIYIVGFRDKNFFEKFQLPDPISKKIRLENVLSGIEPSEKNHEILNETLLEKNLFGEDIIPKTMSLSSTNGFNDYFLFNDLRNGHSTIHSWDILETTQRQKDICYLLLRNRRKSTYGNLDGNPLSFQHFKDLDRTISEEELEELVKLEILKKENSSFFVDAVNQKILSEDEKCVLECQKENLLFVEDIKTNRTVKIKKIPIAKTLISLQEKNILRCREVKYDFKNSKISTGLFGINRIFLPTSDIFPTLVASDTNDYVALKNISAKTEIEYREKFIKEIYKKGAYRKITQEEALLMQGFPKKFRLPEKRARWMKLIGNSVSVPVIEMIGNAILKTGILEEEKTKNLE